MVLIGGCEGVSNYCWVACFALLPILCYLCKKIRKTIYRNPLKGTSINSPFNNKINK